MLARGYHGAGCEREPTGVRKAEAGVAGCAFGERRGEHGCVLVVVVVDLGRCLARVYAQDPSGVLDEPALEGQRCGEEQRVQGRAIETFANIRTGSDH